MKSFFEFSKATLGGVSVWIVIAVIAFTALPLRAEQLDYDQLIGLWTGTISNNSRWSSPYSLEILQVEMPDKIVIARQYCARCSGGNEKYSANWSIKDGTERIVFTSPENSEHTEKVWVLENPSTITATGKYAGKPGDIKISLAKSKKEITTPKLNVLKGVWMWKRKNSISLDIKDIDESLMKFSGKLIIAGGENSGEYDCDDATISVEKGNLLISFAAKKSTYKLNFFTSSDYFPVALNGAVIFANGRLDYPIFQKN